MLVRNYTNQLSYHTVHVKVLQDMYQVSHKCCTIIQKLKKIKNRIICDHI